MDYVGSTHLSTTHMPTFPAHNDSAFRNRFDSLQKSINTTDQILDVPQVVDKHIFFTVGYGLGSANSCRPFKACIRGYHHRYRIIGSVNNISFVTPNTTGRSLLEYAYLRDRGTSVSASALDLEFPSQPRKTFNYTGTSIPYSQWFSEYATELNVLNFNASVQVSLF